MVTAPRSEVTRILLDLSAAEAADPQLTERLFELVYGELRSLAASLMRRERAGHTLQPTALVHEAYLRLVDRTRIGLKDRGHFIGVAARAMRQILVDHARRRGTVKRGGEWERVTLESAEAPAAGDTFEVIRLNEALERFAALDPRAARVVELRVFGGLEVKETAALLGVSPRTVDGDWATARMWLARELGSGGA
jgi:RNA polymerase sigma factor (TIGR02999 family)